jgi:uncharacterized membrane protein YeaQ/YmgE (transglycosylase-associated protein family)
MGIIAWILLGLVPGLLAQRLLPGRNAQGLALTCATAVCGALSGGWTAVSLVRTRTGGPAEPRLKKKAVPVTVPVRRHDAYLKCR